jgi:hypothetical protein
MQIAYIFAIAIVIWIIPATIDGIRDLSRHIITHMPVDPDKFIREFDEKHISNPPRGFFMITYLIIGLIAYYFLVMVSKVGEVLGLLITILMLAIIIYFLSGFFLMLK